MEIALGMKELTQDIASSHKDRAKRLGEIKGEAKQVRDEAQKLIKDFQGSRKETGAELRTTLAQDKAQRKSETIDILKEAQDLINGFETSRKEIGSQLRKDLSIGATNRRSEVNEALEDAQELIKGFQTSRKGMGFELRKELAQSRSNVKSEVGQLLNNAQNLVKDFKESHKEMGSKLRKDLTQGRADRESEVKEMQGDFRKAQAEVRADLKEARAAWQGMTQAMEAKGAGVKLEEKVRVPDLEAKLLAAVRKHPMGITLAEVAESLGVVPIVLGRAARSLLEKGKIRKWDKIYFPVTHA